MQFHDILFIQRIKYIELINDSSEHSITYGFNRASPLLQLPGFDITTCLPFDIMHTIYERIIPRHLNLLLHYVLNDKNYLSLSQLNHIIKVHQYGHTEIDMKPSLINRGITLLLIFGSKCQVNLYRSTVPCMDIHTFAHTHMYSIIISCMVYY